MRVPARFTIFALAATILLAAGCSSRRPPDLTPRRDAAGLLIDAGVVPDLGGPRLDVSDSDRGVHPTPDLGGASPDARRRPDARPTCDPAKCKGFGCSPVTHRCRTVCYTDRDCAAGHGCDATNKCVARKTCKSAADCGAFACDLGRNLCRVVCGSERDCSGGNTCRGRRCVPLVKCKDDTTCKGFTCNTLQGKCRTTCSSAAPCAKGYVCARGTCVKQITCKDDKPCFPYKCNTKTNLCQAACLPLVNRNCASGYHCSGRFTCVKKIPCKDSKPCKGYTCRRGTCRPYCTPIPFVAPCASTHRCLLGICVPR